MILRLPPASVDLSSGSVTGGAQASRLTPTERKLLACLLERPGATWSREVLMSRVWGYSPRVVSRAVDVALCRLRAKIEVDASEPRWILSTPGMGVRLEVPPSLPEGAVYREAEIAAAEAALTGRIVTLTGPGGAGKTHLARLISARAGGCVCSLDSLQTPSEVVRAVGRALSADWEGRELTHLGALARGNGLGLLVLDDADLAVEAVIPVIRALMDGHPELRLLVTSREPLAITDERVVPVAGLTAEQARALFQDRAGAAASTWADPVLLDEILAAVDHLPLGVELVAGWIDALPARELNTRIRARPDLLVDERRDTHPRHRSLFSLAGVSIHALDTADAAVLAALATFAGDFDSEAAEAVAGRDGLVALRRLCRRSLVHPVADRPGWFRLYEVVRTWLRLHRPDPEAAARLGRWLARFGDDDALDGPATRRLVWAPDLRAAVESTSNAGDFATAARCARAWARTSGTEVEPALVLLDQLSRQVDPSIRADLDLDRVQLAWESGRFALANATLTAIEAEPRSPPREVRSRQLRANLCREAGDLAGAEASLRQAECVADALPPHVRGSVLRDLGIVLARSGRSAEAEASLATAVELVALSPHAGAAASAMLSLAQLYRETGRDGTGLLRNALALHRAAGQRRSEGIVLGQLGIAAIDAGDLAGARQAFDDAVEVLKRAGAPHVAAVFAANRAYVERVDGRPDEAERRYRAVLPALRDARDPAWEALALGNLGEIALEGGRVAESIPLLEESARLAHTAGFRKVEGVFLGSLGVARARQGELGPAKTALDAAEVILRTGGFRDESAKLWARRAELAFAAGDPDEGARALDLAREQHARAAWSLAAIEAVVSAFGSERARGKGPGAG